MPRHSEETKQKARDMRATGMSQSEIGKQLGVATSTVCTWVNPKAAEKERTRSKQRRLSDPDYAEWCKSYRLERQKNDSEWANAQRERNRKNIQQRRTNDFEFAEKCRQYNREWQVNNRERVRKNNKRWLANNKDKTRAYTAERRARRRHATPPWLSPKHRDVINAIFAEARRLEELTGCSYHVDHIIPLTTKGMVEGKWTHIACGLHVPWNLRVIPSSDNCRKNCRLPGPEDWTA